MEKQLVVIGGGRMGGALIRAVISTNVLPASQVLVVEKVEKQAAEIRQSFGCEVVDSIPVKLKDVAVVLAIKTQDYRALAPEIAQSLSESCLVVSFMAGVKLATLFESLGNHKRLIRCMPNLPAQVGNGMTVYLPYGEISEEDAFVAIRLLDSMGISIRAKDEDKLDAATAISGSGPGYVAYFAEKMIEEAQALGFNLEESRMLVGQTFLGATNLFHNGLYEPTQLREMVTSPNGTTFAALNAFESSGVGNGIRKGLRAAYERSKELGK